MEQMRPLHVMGPPPHVLIHFFILQQTFAEDLLRGGCFAGGIHTRVNSKYHEVTVSVVGW